MEVFLVELVKMLDAEDKHWRRTMIILHDGARYCNNEAFMETMRHHRVPFMMSSANSYNISWIELLFGAIKQGDLNQEKLPTGKG